MAGEKTEKPTDKKLLDSAKKGQSYKSRDMVVLCILVAGVGFTATRSFNTVVEMYCGFIEKGFKTPPADAARELVFAFLTLSLPIILACVVATVLPSLWQSRLVLATEAIKIDFSALNPVAGFKKLFSMKTVKELVKAVLYLLLTIVVAYAFWVFQRHMLLAQLYVSTTEAGAAWVKAGVILVFYCVAAFIFIIGLDAWVDYLLYIKNLKMEKHEVKQEYKQAEVSSEVKSRRREVHEELLSEQIKSDVAQSQFVLANPTHIAIGVYMDTESLPLPFVSVLETEQKARAVIAYAEKIGIPVVRDIRLTRAIFKVATRYTFVPYELVEEVYKVLFWLLEVEKARAGNGDAPTLAS
ncbi:EscU/YscU/HrcU family type III secretion system export apparatus switch protein [Iodobacter sp. LRB]|uniref:EscU/YscU/HrcU family type III secretion system export apparatus switch protein n=1 Tax=unclassified Iodobacter TaxID=235634 RepID=UPI000C0C5F51|nr:EscU/YscU/HrcU family type III secretion system export apparatus switch protein [Iodobacter sp. BJB302]PHU99933.1 EscU/YscU/HrcU family type III secretion system export apparatus switch protein [Iodobacter sp. BJB302]